GGGAPVEAPVPDYRTAAPALAAAPLVAAGGAAPSAASKVNASNSRNTRRKAFLTLFVRVSGVGC
nr:hypothetical protein [Acidobacteriota bacterium]